VCVPCRWWCLTPSLPWPCSKIAGVAIDSGFCREFADYMGNFLTRYATRVGKAAPDFSKFKWK